jgi:hypothetical protein
MKPNSLSRNQQEFLNKWDEHKITHLKWDWGYNFFTTDGKALYFYSIRGVTRTIDALLRKGVLIRSGINIVRSEVPVEAK